MKNIKYILLSIVSIGLFSCADDDFSIAYVDDEVKTSLTGSIALNNFGASPTTNMMNVTVTLPQTFDVESTVEVTAESTFGNLLAFETYVEKSYITVAAGATTGVGAIKMPGIVDDAAGDFLGIPNYATASISGIALTQPDREDEDGNAIEPYIPIADPFTMTSESVSITAFDFHDPFMAVTENSLKMSLDWEGPYDLNDLDLLVYDPSGVATENSESGTRFEGDFFNNPANENDPDGDYEIEVFIFSSADANPVPYRLVLTHPDGSVTYFDDAIDLATQSHIYPMTQTTDEDGNRTFVISSRL